MDEVIPGLWVGGLSAALSIDYLTQAGITHIITCMKQRLPPPPTLLDGRTIPASNMRQVRIDDLDQAPILAHFTSCNDFIADVLQEEWVQDDADAEAADGDGEADSPASDEKVAGDDLDLLVQGKQKRDGKWGHWQTTGSGTVLIHCQAGCSRSVAITAAYLMHTRRISTSDAVRMIQARRARAQPNAGFMAQLELYEQVGYEVDMRHQAVRRFLMSKTDILNGDSFDDMLLSYYPSPYPSPALSQGLKGLSTITSASGVGVAAGDTSDVSELDGAGISKHSSGRSTPSRAEARDTVNANTALSTSPTAASMGDNFSRLSHSDTTSSSSSTSIRQREEVRVTKNSGRLPGGVSSIKGHEGLENRGKLPKPTFSGPKLRCKACRRELAALDHVIEHQEGQGQMAFEHRRREAGNAKYADQTRATSTSGPAMPAAAATAGAGVHGEAEMQKMFGARPSVVRKVVDEDDDEDDGESKKQVQQSDEAGAGATTTAATSSGEDEKKVDAAARTTTASRPPSSGGATTAAGGRRIQSASTLSSRLPPHLAALRGGGVSRAPPPSSSSFSSTSTSTPTSTPTGGRVQEKTPEPPRAQTAPQYRGTKILHSSACSAYFIEPMAWMSQLENGEVSGKLSCPATKCGAKLGSWDWAGMQCGCGAWVTPAFALHRSKVDEI